MGKKYTVLLECLLGAMIMHARGSSSQNDRVQVEQRLAQLEQMTEQFNTALRDVLPGTDVSEKLIDAITTHHALVVAFACTQGVEEAHEPLEYNCSDSGDEDTCAGGNEIADSKDTQPDLSKMEQRNL